MTEIVYIFRNAAMPDYIKIGKTSRDNVEGRLKALSDSTAVPAPFECLYAAEVDDATKVEKALHKAFAVDRPNPRREFFTTSPDRIITLLKVHEISDVTPQALKMLDDITEPEDKTAQKRVSAYSLRNRYWTFSEIGIEPGAVLEWVPDPTIKCTVLDDRAVEYDGKRFDSLVELAQKLGCWDDNAPSAPGQFTYKGKLLADIRKQ